jgi:hypothetical protein
MAESAILLAINYIETLEESATGGKSVQLALTPPQSLELAATLTRLANRVLEPPSAGVTRH